MSVSSREEGDEKVTAIQARIETRFTVMNAKLDRILQMSTELNDVSRAAKVAAEDMLKAAILIPRNLLIVSLGTIAAAIAISNLVI